MRIEWRERRPGDGRRWLAGLAAVLLAAAAAAVCARLAGPGACAFRRLTGWPCLTCGCTRAARALLDGRPGEALRLQPLTVAGGAFAALAVCACAWAFWARRRVPVCRLSPRERRALWALFALLLVLNWAWLAWTGV